MELQERRLIWMMMVLFLFVPLFSKTLFKFSFSGAIFSVTAATPVRFHAIDGYMMGILFNINRGLQTRFYRYLGFICAERIDKELCCEDEEDRMILDVISSTEYLTLPPALIDAGRVQVNN
jgi:hypothetical protein